MLVTLQEIPHYSDSRTNPLILAPLDALIMSVKIILIKGGPSEVLVFRGSGEKLGFRVQGFWHRVVSQAFRPFFGGLQHGAATPQTLKSAV